MFPRTLVFGENAKNPLICSRKRKVQKISPRHQSMRLRPRGERGVAGKEGIGPISPGQPGIPICEAPRSAPPCPPGGDTLPQ